MGLLFEQTHYFNEFWALKPILNSQKWTVKFQLRFY